MGKCITSAVRGCMEKFKAIPRNICRPNAGRYRSGPRSLRLRRRHPRPRHSASPRLCGPLRLPRRFSETLCKTNTPARWIRRFASKGRGIARSAAWRLSPRAALPATKTEYTCPMHPEIVRDEPGSCPICGMALEPRTVNLEEEKNPELVDMTRRFWISVALTIPVLVIAMADVIPGLASLLRGASPGICNFLNLFWRRRWCSGGVGLSLCAGGGR